MCVAEHVKCRTSRTVRVNMDVDVLSFVRDKFGAVANAEETLHSRIFSYDLNRFNRLLRDARVDSDLFFRDGRRRIDFVLAFEDAGDEMGRLKRAIRKGFENNIRAAGLQIELENAASSFDGKTLFLKVHAPDDVLQRNADVLDLKHPVQEYILTYYSKAAPKELPVGKWWPAQNSVYSALNCRTIPPEPEIYRPGFLPDTEDKYVLKERQSELTNGQRTQIVWQILARLRIDDKRENAGLQRLLAKEVYLAGFPLHEGEYDYGDSTQNESLMNERRLLYLEWASIGNWSTRQPLWLIKKYFGVNIGLYFAWLGFYTNMLVIPALVGTLCFVFGLVTVLTPLNRASEDICDTEGMGNVTMCPQCDFYCPYWKLSDACILSRVTYLFDNDVTVFFSIFMSFWATIFLELWKRRQAILQWEWDLGSDDDDLIRPEYETGVKTTRLNPITQRHEPYVMAREKMSRLSLSYTIVFVMLVAVLGAVFSIIVFRIVIIQWMYERTARFPLLNQYAKIIATTTAATINAIVIEISGVLFQVIARKITSWEQPRTQADYENSYTFKMFLFQFINYYSSLIYTAFFKGRFFTYPGDAGSRHDVISRLKTDMCDPAGCLYEISLLLGIYMIGRQIASNCLELFFPKFKNWLRSTLLSMALRRRDRVKPGRMRRWEADYQLEEIDRLHLFDEYIEMIVQYGFVTLFVAAFPLAPLLALLNNVFEIRLDAYKYTTQFRRPVAQQVTSIGIWYGILQGITYLSVVFNAFVIAMTSEFVPRSVYIFFDSPTFSMKGYVNYSLAVFRTSDWGSPEAPTYFGPILGANVSTQPYEECRYRAYRESPDAVDEYGINKTWLYVFAARLAFVAIFEHLILLLNTVLAYAIPDVPNNLSKQMLRERQLQRELQFAIEKQANRNPLVMEEGAASASLTGSSRRRSQVLNEALRIRTGFRRQYSAHNNTLTLNAVQSSDDQDEDKDTLKS